MIRYTKKTREVLAFIKEYDFATIRIIANIFYKNNSNGKEQARVMLAKLVKSGDLIKWKIENQGEYIFQGTKSKVSDHKLHLVRFYSEIYKLADEVVYFKLEERWEKRRSDAHIIFKTGNIVKCFLVELDKFHSTDVGKYDELYDGLEVHKWYKDNLDKAMFPDVIIIDASGVTKVKSNRDYKISCLDFNFTDLLSKVII